MIVACCACGKSEITEGVFSLGLYPEQIAGYPDESGDSGETRPQLPSASEKQKKSSTTRRSSTTSSKKKTTTTTRVTSSGGQYKIVVYNGSQSTVVYKLDTNGKISGTARVFRCSTGAKNTPTRTGEYKIRAKYRWRWLVGGVYGQFCSSISPDYLFHSVPYLKKDPSTLEDAEYDKLGTPASKGCIRMCVEDCKWIYDSVPIGTVVSVVNDKGPVPPAIRQRKKDAVYSGWDPTDKWASGNPYFSEDPTAGSTTESTTATETESTSTCSGTTGDSTSAPAAATTVTSASQPDGE